jgi:hypothetical protein
MQLTCENCGAEFESGKVSRRMRFAVCSFCGTLHNIAEITARRNGRAYVPPPVFLPKGVDVEDTDAGVRVRFRHSNAYVTPLVASGLLIAAALAIAFPFAWMDASFGNVRPALRVTWVVFALLLLPSIYTVVANLVNYRIVLIAPTGVRVSSGPLPLKPARWIGFQGVRGVVARRYLDSQQANSFQGYSVSLKVVGRDDIEVSTGFTDPEVADVLRHYLLQATGLQPRSLPRAPGRTRVLFRGAQGSEPAAGARAPAKLELACRSCGAPIPLRNIRRELLAADCTQCGVIQDVRPFLRHGVPRRRRNPGFHPPWELVEGPDALEVWNLRPWRALAGPFGIYVAGAILCLAGIGLSLVFEPSYLLLLGILVFGLGGTFRLFWPYMQGRHVAAGPAGVVLTSRPFGSLRRREFPASSVAQLVSLATVEGLSLVLILKDNQRVPLLDGLHDWAHALYLEQRIENLLNVQDVTVHNVRRPTS